MSEVRRYSYTRTPPLPWAWLSLTLGQLLISLSGVLLAARGRRLAGESTGRNLLGMSLAAVVLGGPLLTRHELHADRLVVRQGLNFTGTIPYQAIAAVHATERMPTQFPLRLYRHTLFAVLWPVNLVSIRLKQPQSFRLLGVLPTWKVGEVVINVDRRAEFLADLRARVTPEG